MSNSNPGIEAAIKWQQDVWFGIFIGTAVVGTVGNILIVWIIMAHKTMHTKLNRFILNMVICDLIVSFGSIPLAGYQQVYQAWIFGSVACTIQEIIETSGVSVFILALTMTVMDRHYAILPPAKRDILDMKTMTTLEIWISGIILSAPNWIFATLHTPTGTTDPQICMQVWPDAETGNSLHEIYSVFFIFITYVLPLTYMFYRFCRLSINIWGMHHWPTSAENKQSVKMMIVVVATYAISMLPLRFCTLFDEICYDMAEPQTDQVNWYTFVFWLAFSDSMFNPIIFCCMDQKFRLGFRKAIRWFPMVHYNPNNKLEVATESITMQEPVLSIPEV